MFPDAANRRYTLRTIAFFGGYSVVNIAAIFGAFDDAHGAGAVLLALAVTAPIIGHIWATLALIREGDEFVRALTAKRFILASGAAMAIASAWGFLESYAHATHLPAWLIYPLFWLCFAMISPFVRTTR